MKKLTAKAIKAIVEKFATLEGAQFAGIKEYRSKTTNELANHVVIANFSYYNAVQKDLKALKEATTDDIAEIAKSGNFSTELVEQAINKLATSFENNLNPETQSNQSKAQSDAYLPVTNSIRYNFETGLFYIYALAVNKQVIEAGEYKSVNSRELTLCQNAVKKYFNFSTAKFRNFIIEAEQLTGVNIDGDKMTVQ